DFSRAPRPHPPARATAHPPTILATARALLWTAMPLIEQRGCTLVGVSVGNLHNDDDGIQLTLPFAKHSGGALDAALDDVRERFGTGAVARAVHLGKDLGMTVPLLPD